MKKILRLLLVLSILMLSLGSLIACGGDNTDSDDGAGTTPPTEKVNQIESTVSGGEVTITGIRLVYQPDVVIPDTIDGLPVTKIAAQAFDAEARASYDKITSVKLGANVREIGEKAFYSCSKLTTITTGTEITKIGKSAFENCTALTSFTLSGKVTDIDDRTFAGCKSLAGIDLTGVTQVKENAFSNCGQTIGKFEVTGTDNLSLIGDYAFKYCALESIVLGNKLTKIGLYAFQNSSITTVTLPDSLTELSTGAFANCAKLKSVTFGTGITTVKTQTFKLCASLKTVNFSSTIKTIDTEAFASCGFENLTIPGTVSRIESKAFVGCYGIEILTIKNGVRYIGAHAFGDGTTSEDTVQFIKRINLENAGNWTYSGTTDEPAGGLTEEELESPSTIAFAFWTRRDRTWTK